MEGKPPRTVIVMTVGEIYFQCARAIVRSDLWNPDKRVDPRSLPTPGQILASMSENTVGGESYDREWPERAQADDVVRRRVCPWFETAQERLLTMTAPEGCCNRKPSS